MRDNRSEVRQEAAQTKAGLYIDVGLTSAVTRAGGLLGSVTLRYKGYEVLLILRAEFPAGPMVAFETGDSATSCIRKAYARLAKQETRWKTDKYASTIAQ